MTCSRWVISRSLARGFTRNGRQCWNVMMKYLLVLKSCMGTHVKQWQSKVHNYQYQPQQIRLWDHNPSTSDPNLPDPGPTWPVYWYKAAPIFSWDSILMTQRLCKCLIWMYEVVWGIYQPQTWRNDIIFTSQLTLTSQIWGQLGQCNSKRVHPYVLETT